MHRGYGLREGGHEIRDVSPPDVDYWKFVDAHMKLLTCAIAVAVNGMTKGRPTADWKAQLEPAIFDGYLLGAKLSAEEYVKAIERFHSVGRRMERFMVGYDLVLSPTLTQLPAKLGIYSMNDDFRRPYQRVGSTCRQRPALLDRIRTAGGSPAHWPLRSRRPSPTAVRRIGTRSAVESPTAAGSLLDLLRVGYRYLVSTQAYPNVSDRNKLLA